MVGEPAQVARFVHAAGIHARNFRRLLQTAGPRVDVVLVLGDVVACGRGQNDVQIVDAAKRRDERSERRDDAPVARQEAEDIGVEAEAAHARDRRRRKTCGAERGPPRDGAATTTECWELVSSSDRRCGRPLRPPLGRYVTLHRRSMHVVLLRPVPGNERFGLGPFFRIEPLGMEYIASALEASGTHGDARRSAVQPLARASAALHASPVGLVGIAAMHALETDDVMALARRVRQLAPGVPIVIGGHTAAAYPRPFLLDPVDAVILDDGERAVPRIADAIEAGRPLREVPGLTVREPSGEVIATPADSASFELDEVPLPARHLVAPVAASVRVSRPSARVVDRDRAGMSVPLLVLFDLAAARAVGPGAFDRIGVPGLRRVGRPRLRRRRSVLAPPAAQPRAREGAAPPRNPEAMDSRAEPRRSGRAQRGAARGLAPDRAGLRYLLRPRGGDQRRAQRPEEGRDRRSDRTGRGGCALVDGMASPATS